MDVRVAGEPAGWLGIFGRLDQNQRQEEQDKSLAGRHAIYHMTERANDERAKAALRFRRVLLICLRDVRLAVIAVMDDDAVAKRQRLAFRNGPAAVLIGIAREIAKPERIGGEQAVAARMPGGRMTEAFRVVEYRDAYVFAFHFAVIIHPVGPLTPDGFLAFRAERIY